MTAYWAVLLDETGCEFGAGVTASDKAAAYDYLRENYPESRVVQVESPEDRRERERAIEAQVLREVYGDYWDEDFTYDPEDSIDEDDPYWDEKEG